MADEWMKARVDQHTTQINGLQKAQGILAHRVKVTEGQYSHLHSCLHAFRGETRQSFESIHGAMHKLEDRLKDQLHETDSKWNERIAKVENRKVEVKPETQSRKDESLVTLRDAIWFLVAAASILAVLMSLIAWYILSKPSRKPDPATEEPDGARSQSV